MVSFSLEFITTDEHLRRLCEYYWEVSPYDGFAYVVGDIARRFGIKQPSVIPLVNRSCNAQVQGAACMCCGGPLILRTRTEFRQYESAIKRGEDKWACYPCRQMAEEAQHAARAAANKLHLEHLAAQAAQKVEAEKLRREQLAAQEKLRRDAVRLAFANPGHKREPVDPLHFSLSHVVWFLSLVRLGASEDLSFIEALESLSEPLSGDRAHDVEILKSLYKCGFIHVDPDSPLTAFKFDEDKTNTYYVERVRWVLSDKEHAKYVRFALEDLEIIFRKKRWAARWHDDLLQLWKDVALRDCLDFLRSELAEHNFDLNPGEKTILVLRGALEEYSPGQVFNMIWRATRDAASFYMKGGVTVQHAANTVVGAIQRHAERARARGWDLKAFWRSQKYPQPMISQVLFNIVLQIEEKSMSIVPGDLSRVNLDETDSAEPGVEDDFEKQE